MIGSETDPQQRSEPVQRAGAKRKTNGMRFGTGHPFTGAERAVECRKSIWERIRATEGDR